CEGDGRACRRVTQTRGKTDGVAVDRVSSARETDRVKGRTGGVVVRGGKFGRATGEDDIISGNGRDIIDPVGWSAPLVVRSKADPGASAAAGLDGLRHHGRIT